MLLRAIAVGAMLQLPAAPPQGLASGKPVTSTGKAGSDELVVALSDTRVDVRRSAASALALRDDIGLAIPALYAALLDPDRAVRRSACEAIRRFRGANKEMLRAPCPAR